MRYSIKPRDIVYVKGYGFTSFARRMSYKYGQKLVDTAKKNLLQMQYKPLLKEQYKNLLKQQLTWKVIKLLIQ